MKFKYTFVFIVIFFFASCATYEPQYKKGTNTLSPLAEEIEHTFYLIGDAGYLPDGLQSKALKALESELKYADANSTLLFLGDNIYPKGMPEKGDESRNNAEQNINEQLKIVSQYKGQTIFIPGNHDWYTNGLEGLERQEDYIKDVLGKGSFLPKNGCPIDHVSISDDIELIIIDSKWYLTNWDKHPTINDKCDIKTREAFFDEFESKVKKARGKTTIVAMHHPMYSNGPHGGQFSFADHMKPVPVLGTVKNVLRETTGVVPEDIQNKRYNDLRQRIITLAQENNKVIFVSGHEHSLQYLEQDNLIQIISGSGSKKTETRNRGGGLFSYGQLGYAKLEILKTGASQVGFFAIDSLNPVFTKQIFKEQTRAAVDYPKQFQDSALASIYSEDEVEKNSFYKFLWGERYSDAYSTKIRAKTVNLDTLYGGLEPIRRGGGTQTNSLRLKDKSGREYVMRGLRKNALNFIQATAFADQFVEGQFNDTETQDLILYVFTGSYPYMSLIMGDLSDAADVLHTNPKLYYVPHQDAIGDYNMYFGDELYLIEEHAGDNHGDKASFGYSNELIGTMDMFAEIQSDESVLLDESAFIRARIFDMLLGDWDRHQDQWRWAKIKKGDKTIYLPMPRDRDQVFSNMDDGILMGMASSIIPAAKNLKGYDGELKKPEEFNDSAFALDMALINQSDKSVWQEQVKFIQDNLTDTIIEKAFLNIPKELQNETISDIKEMLKSRRANLYEIAMNYYDYLNRFAVITGTNKDDWFDIERLKNGETHVIGYRIKNGKKADVFYDKIYNSKETKEIWIYALDDDDVLHVFGNGDKLIKMRLIGGQNNDIYDIQNGKKISVYDYKSKKNTVKTKKGKYKLIDDYETNIYDYKKFKNNTNQFLPIIGFNPDDGVKLGFANVYTAYGFERNPFSSRHSISGAYFFATNGFALNYKGEFANVFGRLNFGLETVFTSPNYNINFFGFGNETENPNTNGQELSLDYNRVKVRTFKIAPSLIKKGELGSEIKWEFVYESIEVEKTEDRFINDYYNTTGLDNSNNFLGTELSYYFKNVDNDAYPTLGMTADFKIGHRYNIKEETNMGYFVPSLSFDFHLDNNRQLVLATKLQGHLTFGNDYEFYQGASIGASNGLRGFRNQRFTGKHSYYQLTDLRYSFSKLKQDCYQLI